MRLMLGLHIEAFNPLCMSALITTSNETTAGLSLHKMARIRQFTNRQLVQVFYITGTPASDTGSLKLRATDLLQSSPENERKYLYTFVPPGRIASLAVGAGEDRNLILKF